MPRLLSGAFLLLLVGLASYSGSFYVTRAVFAATACGAPNPPCRTYHTGQQGNDTFFSGYSHGIEGSIRYQDVAMYSTTDTLAHWLTMVNFAPLAWAQMGFVEGQDPNGVKRTNVVLYSERSEGAICQSYRFSPINPAPYNPDYPMIYWTGQSIFCSPEGKTGYTYSVGRMGGAPLDTVYLPAALNNFQAYSEEKIMVFMEPNGTQRFGDSISLFLYNKGTGYWDQWGVERPTFVRENQENSRYYHNPIDTWTSFTTTSVGW